MASLTGFTFVYSCGTHAPTVPVMGFPAMRFPAINRRQLQRLLFRHNAIATLKGVLAYIIFFVLFFLHDFDSLFAVPAAGTGALLICIAGFPGQSVGACVQGVIMALLGVALGAFNFFVLAEIANSPVGQAFLFFFIVYLLGMLKALGPKWFAFSLLGISISWDGITSTVNNRMYDPASLISNITAYLWGAAIVLFVNIFIFPHTAEKELRMALVASLDHCRTFGCLLSKTYRLEIDEEEIRVRDELAQSIRADFSILQSKIAETSTEIVWSKWSLSDYRIMVHKTRSIQQILTTIHTNFKSSENFNSSTFKKHFLAGFSQELDDFNEAVFLVYNELEREIGVEIIHETEKWESFNQKQAEDFGSATNLEAGVRLRSVEQNLESELNLPGRSESVATGHDFGKVSSDSEPIEQKQHVPIESTTQRDHTSVEQLEKPDSFFSNLTDKLKTSYDAFEKIQYRKVGDYLSSGELYHPDEPLVLESFTTVSSTPCSNHSEEETQSKHSTNNKDARTIHPEKVNSSTSAPKLLLSAPGLQATNTSTQTEQSSIHDSLTRVFSYSFSTHDHVSELIGLLGHVTGKGWFDDGHHHAAKTRKKSLHFHFFEAFKSKFNKRKNSPQQDNNNPSPTTDSFLISEEEENRRHHDLFPKLSMREALHSLSSNKPTPLPNIRKTSRFIESLIKLEDYFRGPDSICAFKAACGAIVLGIFFWADDTRKFSTEFGLTSGLITILVAITPTLGESWLSFIFQICGQALGLIYAMSILLIFRDVGGYKYNPYGLISAVALFACPLLYMVYNVPKLFVFCLLALMSSGSTVYITFLSRNVKSSDPPPSSVLKSFTSLSIALAIVTLFQLFILRNPAKKTLRLQVARVMKGNTAYTIILQAYVRAMHTTDPKQRPSQIVLSRVFQHLIECETHLQSQIISLIPLIQFAGAEPSFVKDFNAEQYLKLVKANQFILDRNRDARMAIGDKPIPTFLIKEFVERLTPHRERDQPHARVSFYLCTSSLESKFPLPERLPVATEHCNATFHDALVLSIRLSKDLSSTDTRELSRYWSYLLSVTSVCGKLEEIIQSIQALFGHMEDDPLTY